MSHKFTCERCNGSGQAFGKKCYTCRGAGGWAKSPEQREYDRKAQKAKRDRDAQSKNLNSKVYSIAKLYAEQGNPVARDLMQRHAAGMVWTPNQIYSIRAIRNGNIHGNSIARRVAEGEQNDG